MVLRTVASPAPLPLPSPPLCAPKQGILGSRTQKNALPCPKTCHFGIPNLENLAFVGQNRRFCPSTAGKTALRWAKQALLPIRGREKRQRRVKEPGWQGVSGKADNRGR